MKRLRNTRYRTALNTYHLHHGPNMTPMVDVVMVILIFFMATASVLGPEWYLKTSIPRAAAADAPKPEQSPIEIRLTVAGGGVVAAWGEEGGLTPEQVGDRLASLAAAGNPESLVVLLKPAGDVPYEAIIGLHERCERLGIVKVAIVAE